MALMSAAVDELNAEAHAECAGPSGAGGSSAGAGGAEGSSCGMRIYLSQIKEWMVEFACDMVFIVIRTDCAWYKIRSVHSAYSGWFEPILKVARLAVSLLGMIQEESRSSKLSFGDLAKRISALPATAPTFVSNKLPAVRITLVLP
jgi:DNA (cytosine-5)-methyltransferase 1